MNKKIFCLFLSILLLAAFSSACEEKVTINTEDSTPPTVALSVIGDSGKFEKARVSVLDDQSEILTFFCTATDKEGIKSVELTFSPKIIGPCYVENTIYNSGFPLNIAGKLIEDYTVPAVVDGENKVPTEVALSYNFGPATCNVPGKGDGFTYNNYITLTCKAKNWGGGEAVHSATVAMNPSLLDLKDHYNYVIPPQ